MLNAGRGGLSAFVISKRMELEIVVGLYFLCGLLSWYFMYGFEFAYWQGEYPMLADQDYKKDLSFSAAHSLIAALIWPVGWCYIFVMFVAAGHGFKLK